MNDDDIINTAGNVEEELLFLVSATQLRNNKGADLLITVDICTMIGVDCEMPDQSTLFDCS